MSNRVFAALALAVALAIIAASQLVANEYFFSATYTVGNSGPAVEPASMLAVFRREGDDPNNSQSYREFEQAIRIPAGGGRFTFSIDTRAAGLIGRYIVGFRVLDGAGVPIGSNPDPAQRGFFA